MATPLAATPKLFIGMDIHKKSWSIHLRTDICEHKSFTTPPHCEVLYQYVSSNFPAHEVHLAYEAGCCGFSAARTFLNYGWQVVVVNPSDIPRMDKHYYQKTDKIDCRNLSKQLQAGQLKGIHIPNEAQDELKSLLRQRAEVTKGLRSVKARIKSLLLYHGIPLPEQFDNPNWSKEFIAWLHAIQWKHRTGKMALSSMLRTYDLYYREHLQIANELRDYCRTKHQKDYYLLKSIPGIGGYLASAVLAEVGDLRRFNTEAQFASYIGLIPMMRSSGSTENTVGVTPRCRALLRSYIIESAWVAYRLDPEMQAYYRRHIGKNPKSIIVKIARKMLNRMLAVIKSEKAYQINYNTQKQSETKQQPTQKQTTKQR